MTGPRLPGYAGARPRLRAPAPVRRTPARRRKPKCAKPTYDYNGNPVCPK